MLALWDIDGTLLRVDHGIGREMYVRSFRTLLGVDVQPIVEGMSFAGRTDRGLVYDIVAAAGVPRSAVDEVWLDFTADMATHAVELITPSTLQVLDGAVETLNAFVEQGIICGLLTGNIDSIAQHKLSMAGMPKVFCAGAYGGDHADRRELPPLAIGAVNASLQSSFGPSDAVIIGDAIGDVDCARAHGIPCIAVTTGVHSDQELRDAGAAHVILSLAPANATTTLLRQVLGYL